MKKKSVFLLDVDKTCYDGFSPIELALNEKENGLISAEEFSLIANDLEDYKNGLSSYEDMAQKYINHEVQILSGKNRQKFVENARHYFLKNQHKFYPFLKEIVSKYKSSHDFYFISSGFDYSLEIITEMFQFSGYRCNILQTNLGTFDNKLELTIYDSSDKEIISKNLINQYIFDGSVGMGDSISDVGIMESCQFAMAINPSEELSKKAKEINWLITKPSEIMSQLNVLLDNNRNP